MKTGDLMIGDWVMFTGDGDSRPIKIIGITMLKQVELWDGNDWRVVGENYIHPIEITRDILINAGFKKQYIDTIDTTVYARNGFPFVIEVVFDGNDDIPHDKLYSVCYLNNEREYGDPLETIINIRYVHELQHLLNMFNINFEI